MKSKDRELTLLQSKKSEEYSGADKQGQQKGYYNVSQSVGD